VDDVVLVEEELEPVKLFVDVDMEHEDDEVENEDVEELPEKTSSKS
jgi:hypothetical protein